MITVTTPMFQLGRLLITPGAQEALAATGESPWTFLSQHSCGRWGIVDEGDAALNDDALNDGSRLLSAYKLKDGTKIWVITEAVGEHGREATTILLPEEY